MNISSLCLFFIYVANVIQMDALTADGGADVRINLGLSGEPQPAQIGVNRSIQEQKTVLEVPTINIAKRTYQKEYLDYWNSTLEHTETGRPVDGFLSPVSAHSAVIPGKSLSTEYTTVSSLLDYSCVVVPVTHLKKKVDLPKQSRVYLSEWDKLAQDDCKCSPLSYYRQHSFTIERHLPRISTLIVVVENPDIQDLSTIGIQLVGRRFEEEKVLTLAEYIQSEITKGLK